MDLKINGCIKKMKLSNLLEKIGKQNTKKENNDSKLDKYDYAETKNETLNLSKTGLQ